MSQFDQSGSPENLLSSNSDWKRGIISARLADNEAATQGVCGVIFEPSENVPEAISPPETQGPNPSSLLHYQQSTYSDPSEGGSTGAGPDVAAARRGVNDAITGQIYTDPRNVTTQ